MLAATPGGQLCPTHERAPDAPVGRRAAPSRPPRAARSLAYGRQRAAWRVEHGRWAVHPGWRHRVPCGRVVLTDQRTAIACARELVDDELWRADRHRAWLALCEALAAGMDWTTGLVTGVTRDHLAARAGVSTRTVSRLLAWAYDTGLLVCVEAGATAEFLGTSRNRAPAYVFTRPVGAPPPRSLSAQVSESVDELGNPPASCVRDLPLGGTRGPEKRHDKTPGKSAWPVRDRPRTPAERTAATRTLMERTGLTGRVALWRAHGLLSPWWQAGACVAGLLHAVDHHPDRPDVARGDALRSARDPLGVLGHRLAPWRERLGELPPVLVSVDPDDRRRRTERLLGHPAGRPPPTGRPAGRAGIDAARRLFAARRASPERNPDNP